MNRLAEKNSWTESPRKSPEQKHSKEEGALQSTKNNRKFKKTFWEEEEYGNPPKQVFCRRKKRAPQIAKKSNMAQRNQ